MKFHLPSFAIGYAAGFGTHAVGHHLKPFLLELATSAYRVMDAVAARAAMQQERLDDLLAEARARARNAAHVGGRRSAPETTAAEA